MEVQGNQSCSQFRCSFPIMRARCTLKPTHTLGVSELSRLQICRHGKPSSTQQAAKQAPRSGTGPMALWLPFYLLFIRDPCTKDQVSSLQNRAEDQPSVPQGRLVQTPSYAEAACVSRGKDTRHPSSVRYVCALSLAARGCAHTGSASPRGDPAPGGSQRLCPPSSKGNTHVLSSRSSAFTSGSD